METETLYWWIENASTQTHAEFLRAWLPRASAKIGAAPGVIVCNPADRDALAELAEQYAIETRTTLLAGSFWIGPKVESVCGLCGEASGELRKVKESLRDLLPKGKRDKPICRKCWKEIGERGQGA